MRTSENRGVIAWLGLAIGVLAAITGDWLGVVVGCAATLAAAAWRLT